LTSTAPRLSEDYHWTLSKSNSLLQKTP